MQSNAHEIISSHKKGVPSGFSGYGMTVAVEFRHGLRLYPFACQRPRAPWRGRVNIVVGNCVCSTY